MSSPVQPLL